MVAALLVVLALVGGSARADALVLVFLRPMVVLAAMAILLSPGPLDPRPVRIPAILLGCLALTIAIQLVPLPIDLLNGVAGGDGLRSAEAALPDAPTFMPITLTPDSTWNSLIALLPAAVVLLGYAAIRPMQRFRLVDILLALICLSAIFSVVQTLSGDGLQLSIYEFVHRNRPIGFMANRNHAAAMLALALPLLSAWVYLPMSLPEWARLRVPLAVALGIFFIILVLVSGSRSGLVLVGIGIVGAMVVRPARWLRLSRRQFWAVVLSAPVALGGLLAIMFLRGRATSIDRLLAIDIGDTELRLKNLPAVIEAVRDFFPLGSGFGSFTPLFQHYEADGSLRNAYFNNAHNDFIELVLTGGLAAALVGFAFVIWWGVVSVRLFRAPRETPELVLARAASFGIGILLVASISDYPLRTPFLGAVFALLSALLASGLLQSRKRHDSLVASAV